MKMCYINLHFTYLLTAKPGQHLEMVESFLFTTCLTERISCSDFDYSQMLMTT